jgi:hypothetical protein
MGIEVSTRRAKMILMQATAHEHFFSLLQLPTLPWAQVPWSTWQIQNQKDPTGTGRSGRVDRFDARGRQISDALG